MGQPVMTQVTCSWRLAKQCCYSELAAMRKVIMRRMSVYVCLMVMQCNHAIVIGLIGMSLAAIQALVLCRQALSCAHSCHLSYKASLHLGDTCDAGQAQAAAIHIKWNRVSSTSFSQLTTCAKSCK